MVTRMNFASFLTNFLWVQSFTFTIVYFRSTDSEFNRIDSQFIWAVTSSYFIFSLTCLMQVDLSLVTLLVLACKVSRASTSDRNTFDTYWCNDYCRS